LGLISAFETTQQQRAEGLPAILEPESCGVGYLYVNRPAGPDIELSRFVEINSNFFQVIVWKESVARPVSRRYLAKICDLHRLQELKATNESVIFEKPSMDFLKFQTDYAIRRPMIAGDDPHSHPTETVQTIQIPAPLPDLIFSQCYDAPLMADSKITLEQVRHVALLARLRLGADEETRLQADMSSMLGYVEKLNELNTDDVPPTTQVGEPGTPMRDDVVTNQPAPDDMLGNAPARHGNFFKVPKIIE